MPGAYVAAGILPAFVFVTVCGAAGAQTLDPPAASSLTGSSAVLTSHDGRRQLSAVRAVEGVSIDGVLDDRVWNEATPASGFVQAEPHDGEAATEPTEVFVAYDEANLYIAAYCYDSEPNDVVVSELRKDFETDNQDTFQVILDTFGDRRNGFMFMTNREGARADQQVANEGREINASWDAVWAVRTRRVADGWTLEMAIPFKSLRFARGDAQQWGINFGRQIRRKNEIAYWSPIPRTFNLSRVSEAGDLVGLPGLSAGRNLRVKPYALARSIRETGADAFDGDAELGLDVKYGVTPSLTLDVTLNPDFAQVEADEQQVNLTQFSQFFPEKREFFLENSGIFYVGDAQRSNRRNPTPTPDEEMLLFFSRRIGLTPEGREIPILGGARLTGNVAGVTVGAMSMQTRSTDNQPATNYTVVRARKNIFRNSDVGGFFMSRQATSRSGDYNRVFGVDATFRLFGAIDWSSYAVETETPGVTGRTHAYRSTVVWQGRSSHVRTGMMEIGDDFVSDLSYYRRTGIRKYLLESGYKPRPKALERRGIREVHSHVNWDYQTDLAGHPVAKKIHQGVTVAFNNGGWSEPAVNLVSQQLTRPLRLSAKSPLVPPGYYSWREYQWRINTDPSRMFSIGFLPTWGGLWSGTQKTANLTVTVRPSYRFRAALGLQRTAAELHLPETRFTKNLWTLRANYSFNTNMYLDSLLQHDTDLHQFNANVRFNLIHRPLSDLFLVYNEQQFTDDATVPPGRGLILKFTRMLAF
jgi:hypothetical protein